MSRPENPFRCFHSSPDIIRMVVMLYVRFPLSLWKFVSVHASISNHFNQERHLVDRQTFKARRSAALAEWQTLAA